MSKASMNFTLSVFDDLGIEFFVRKVNSETGVGLPVVKKYHWKEKEHEAAGQQGCQRILESAMLPLEVDGSLLGIYDVRDRALPEVQTGLRKSSGFADLAVGPNESMEYAASYSRDLLLSYAVALVELKTGMADLQLGQLLLQLVSFNYISGMDRGVVIMGTDCASKWWLLYFDGYNRVVVQPFKHGNKCIADFKSLIVEGKARMQRNSPPQKRTSILEHDSTDLDLKEFGVEETDRDKAIERETKLRKLADSLGSLFGETLEVPYWAKAQQPDPHVT